MAGKKERYSGVEHGVEDLVEKSKVDIVVRRQATAFTLLYTMVPLSLFLVCEAAQPAHCFHAAGTLVTLVAFGVCGAAEASLCLRIPSMHGMSVLQAACAADSLVSALSGANGWQTLWELCKAPLA